MSNQVRGFSGVGKLSSPKDALIPPQILAQTPNWNPLKQEADEAKQAQWQKMREQVSMDTWVERQDDSTLQKINRLEQQFAARVNSGQSQSTDQELFPDRHFDKEETEQPAAATHSHHSSTQRYHHKPHQPKDPSSEINWSMWAAAVCLFLVGVGFFGMWLFTGQPDFGSMFSKLTSDSSSETQAPAVEKATKEVAKTDASASGVPADSAASAASAAVSAATETPDTPAQQEMPALAQGDSSSAASSAMSIFDDEEAGAVDMPASSASPAANAPVDTSKASGRALVMSEFLFNQDPNAVNAANGAASAGGAVGAAGSQPNSEQILLTPVSEVTQDSVLTISLPALPKLKRPEPQAVNKNALSPEEYRWCALIQMGTTEVGQSPEVCSSPEVIRYGQDLVPYLPYFKVLGLYRALIEQKRDPQSLGVSLDDLEVQQWMKYKLTSDSDVLNERDTHHCGQSWVVINGYFAMSQFGFNPDALNQQIKHFNDVCGKKIVPITEQKKWMERNDFLIYVQSMLIVHFNKLTSNWVKFTYLPPAQGTAQQMAPEITEAQKLLQQLGYKVSKVTGAMNDETRAAIKVFEEDMGLTAKGDLTFSILLRLRLATQGYDSKQAWQTPLRQA